MNGFTIIAGYLIGCAAIWLVLIGTAVWGHQDERGFHYSAPDDDINDYSDFGGD